MCWLLGSCSGFRLLTFHWFMILIGLSGLFSLPFPLLCPDPIDVIRRSPVSASLVHMAASIWRTLSLSSVNRLFSRSLATNYLESCWSSLGATAFLGGRRGSTSLVLASNILALSILRASTSSGGWRGYTWSGRQSPCIGLGLVPS